MRLEEKIEKYLGGSLNEGMFSEFKNIRKLTKDIMSLTKEVEKDSGSINDVLSKGLEMIDKADISIQSANSFEKSFLKGIWDVMRKQNSSLSGSEIQKKYNLDNKTYQKIMQSLR